MTDQLESRPPIKEAESGSVKLDFAKNRKREICTFIGGGRSFELHVPQGTIDTFLQEPDILFRDKKMVFQYMRKNLVSKCQRLGSLINQEQILRKTFPN